MGPVVPGIVAEKGDLAGAKTVAGYVVRVEILEFVGTDDVLGALSGFIGFALGVGYELGGYFRIQDGLEDGHHTDSSR